MRGGCCTLCKMHAVRCSILVLCCGVPCCVVLCAARCSAGRRYAAACRCVAMLCCMVLCPAVLCCCAAGHSGPSSGMLCCITLSRSCGCPALFAAAATNCCNWWCRTMYMSCCAA
jgi:hypothetical protein